MKKLFILLCIFSTIGCYKVEDANIRNGLLILPDDYSTKTISLKGDWEIYWNVMSDWQEIDKPAKEIQYANVPSSWNNLNPNSNKSFGYATYRLQIKNVQPNEPLYFKLRPQTSAFKIYVNRHEIASVGKVGEQAESSSPEYKIVYSSYEPIDKEIELLMVISNYDHSRGGFRAAIEIGNKNTILINSLVKAGFELFVMGGIIAMGLFHLTMFKVRKKDTSALYFAMFCFINAIRLFVLDNYYINYFIPNVSWEFLVKMDYMTTPLVAPIFLAYIRSLYEEDVKEIALKIIVYSSVSFSLLVLFSSPYFFSGLLIISNAIVALSTLFAFYTILRIHHYKRRDAKLLLTGTFILLIFGIHDLLAGSRVIQDDLMLPIGLFFFFLVQAIVLSRRNATMYANSFALKVESAEANFRLENLNTEYSKYVPTEFIQLMDKRDILDVHVGDFVSKNIAVLSSDIRDFTTFSEGMNPEDNFKFLNAYLSRVAPAIRNNSGIIDKYIGDAVIALFHTGTADAISSGIEMHRIIQDYNNQRVARNFQPISIGIGIHSGESLLGIIGEDVRTQTTAISESVHLASIIEGLTKKYGAKILISLDSLFNTPEPDKYPYRIVDTIRIYPGDEPIGIAEILLEGLDETSNLKIEYKEIFERGVYSFLEGDFQSASDLFEVIGSQIEQDAAASLYYHRSQKYLKYGAPPGWETANLEEA
ncbi:adenylate/guanylate cyclase domain-containing protein [Leptospira sp. GIMC2001]|uniref:adenylate/guanylate cyclase domain-containing protein n=1 Tax=Leptospira sp. GIMC2001 TaxID=1513297 RepID=UPI002349287C|nr:adenylate/guanylate cyclase domain-containing protein [Leptospira sp. GIMC2001]WCL49840.1 adenylate/guanylate cyclase domain-containing protein [Leptospira sp. GIMC2001]